MANCLWAASFLSFARPFIGACAAGPAGNTHAQTLVGRIPPTSFGAGAVGYRRRCFAAGRAGWARAAGAAAVARAQVIDWSSG